MANKKNKASKAKNDTQTAPVPSAVDKAVMTDIPDDFDEVVSGVDVAGLWTNHEIPLYFTPLTARIFDGLDKPACMIIGKLNAPISLEQNGEPVEGETGSYVGVFLKGGMRALLECADSPTMMVRDPSKDKDTGKPNPMLGYKIARKKGCDGKRITVEVDARNRTASMPTAFDAPRNRAQNLAQTEAGEL